MKEKCLEKFMTSWKFFGLLILLQLVLWPLATKNYRFEEAGDLVFYTMRHAFIMDLYVYAVYFQIAMILLLGAIVVWKKKVSNYFTAIVGCFYLLYAVIQNMAVTEEYGFSMVTVNVVMISLVGFVWLRSTWKRDSYFSFANLTWKTGWMIPIALFCLWWPLNPQTGLPDFQLHYFWNSGSALAFCPMTPLFLTLLLLSQSTVSRTVLRVTAMVGLIIGVYNMGNFMSPTNFYLGIYHLPLLCFSIYALWMSRQKKKMNNV